MCFERRADHDFTCQLATMFHFYVHRMLRRQAQNKGSSVQSGVKRAKTEDLTHVVFGVHSAPVEKARDRIIEL